jgi:hypothetical protein
MSVLDVANKNFSGATSEHIAPPWQKAAEHAPSHAIRTSTLDAPAHRHKKPEYIVTPGHAADITNVSTERLSARELRKIKRRLFLEAVNSELTDRPYSPSSVAQQEFGSKKKWTGKE